MKPLAALLLFWLLVGGATAWAQGPPWVPLDPKTQKYGEFELLPANWTAVERESTRHLYGALACLQLAQGYACVDQGMFWAKVATDAVKANSEWISANLAGDPALQTRYLTGLAFFKTGLDAYNIAVQAELGLLDQAAAQLPAFLSRYELKNYRSTVLLSCARTALQQGKTAAAEAYLKQAKSFLNPAFVAPPLRYALLTADYQVRRQKGYKPDAAQTAKDAQEIWRQAFAGYRAFERVQADAQWYYGRKAARYWLRELDPASPATQKICSELYAELYSWLAGTWARGLPQAALDDWYFNSEQYGNYLTALMAVTDIWVAVTETMPVGSAERQGFVPFFEQSMTVAEAEAAKLTLTGEYPFNVTQSGLLCELRGRLNLLKAREATRPIPERVELAERATVEIAKSGDPDTIMEYLLETGRVLAELGQSELAIARWKEALSQAERLGYVEKAVQAAALLATEYGRLGQWEAAGVYADKAAKKAQESMALVAGDAQAAQQLARTSEQVTEVSVKAAVAANDPRKALAAVVRGKETTSAANQMGGKVGAQAEMATVQQQQQEIAVLATQVERLEALPPSSRRDDMLAQTQQLLAQNRSEFLLKSRELRGKYPELYSRVLKFDPLDLPDVQSTLTAEAAVVQYFPTDDALYIFVVTRENFRLRSVPMAEADLVKSITSYARSIRRAIPGDKKLEEESKKLYSLLIEPCLADLEGKSLLVLIPAGKLNLLPFGCLLSADGTPLLESRLVLELAKPTDFMRIQNSSPKKLESVVAFANATGDLPAAGKEGEQIAALFAQSKLFKEGQATRQNFLDFGAKSEVLHLATHGESNTDNALANFLRLTNDEKVAQDEIFSLGLQNTSLVTLSACNTAVGDKLDSKFVASLAEAFWLGGSQSVIASLWSVNDDSTGLLMTEFYRGLQAGKGKAQALKDAQLQVRATEGFEHPYYWGGFLLFGDWR